MTLQAKWYGIQAFAAASLYLRNVYNAFARTCSHGRHAVFLLRPPRDTKYCPGNVCALYEACDRFTNSEGHIVVKDYRFRSDNHCCSTNPAWHRVAQHLTGMATQSQGSMVKGVGNHKKKTAKR